MGTLPELKDCNPGVEAVGFRVIVVMEDAEERTPGGIIIPDSVKDKEGLVAVRGRVVSVGPVAFDFADFPPGSTPQPGDAVMFGKLAGMMFDGADGRKYRIMQDKDINAVVRDDARVSDTCPRGPTLLGMLAGEDESHLASPTREAA